MAVLGVARGHFAFSIESTLQHSDKEEERREEDRKVSQCREEEQ